MADKRTCQAIVKSTGKPCTYDAIGGNGEFCGIHCKCPVRNLLGLKCGEKFFPGFQLCQKHHTLDKQKKKTKPLTAATIQPPPTLAFILSDPVFDGIKVTGVNDFISGDSVNTGATLLHVAAGNDRADLIEKLVGLGADVNIQAEKTISTPLHWAVGKHKIKAVRMLRQLGADPILPNNSSKTVIDVARTESHPKDRSARIPEDLFAALSLTGEQNDYRAQKEKIFVKFVTGTRNGKINPYADPPFPNITKPTMHSLLGRSRKDGGSPFRLDDLGEAKKKLEASATLDISDPDPRVQALKRDFYFAKLRMNTPERIAECMKRAGVSDDVSLQVDHSYEVQLFTHAMIQTPALHRPLVKLLEGFTCDGETCRWFSQSRTPTEFRKFPFSDASPDVMCCFKPIYKMLNGEVDDNERLPFNLRLLNNKVNQSKGSGSYKKYIESRQRDEQFSIFGDMQELFSGNRQTRVPFFKGDSDAAQAYCLALGTHLKETAQEFQTSLEQLAHSKNETTRLSREAHAQLSETIGSFVSYLVDDLDKLRIDK